MKATENKELEKSFAIDAVEELENPLESLGVLMVTACWKDAFRSVCMRDYRN
jgi:hypothetical protein